MIKNSTLFEVYLHDFGYSLSQLILLTDDGDEARLLADNINILFIHGQRDDLLKCTVKEVRVKGSDETTTR